MTRRARATLLLFSFVAVVVFASLWAVGVRVAAVLYLLSCGLAFLLSVAR